MRSVRIGFIILLLSLISSLLIISDFREFLLSVLPWRIPQPPGGSPYLSPTILPSPSSPHPSPVPLDEYSRWRIVNQNQTNGLGILEFQVLDSEVSARMILERPIYNKGLYESVLTGAGRINQKTVRIEFYNQTKEPIGVMYIQLASDSPENKLYASWNNSERLILIRE